MRRRDLARRARIEPEVAKADAPIHPDLGCWAGPSRACFAEARRIGEAATRERLPAVLEALRAAGVSTAAARRVRHASGPPAQCRGSLILKTTLPRSRPESSRACASRMASNG